ncbi:MAG: nitroreductase family protein [Candidatus Izemoplasmataceae bacterium]
MSLCLERKSVRKFKSTPISDTVITELLKSAMQAPSAKNQQPWRFFVIKNQDLLKQLSKVSTGAHMVEHAPIAIVVGFTNDTKSPKMAPTDCAAATQNILLEVVNQNLGAVWIGLYPLEERTSQVKSLLKLDETITPFSMIAIGEPNESTAVTKLRYDASKIKVIE